jgi:hypothetical protein
LIALLAMVVGMPSARADVAEAEAAMRARAAAVSDNAVVAYWKAFDAMPAPEEVAALASNALPAQAAKVVRRQIASALQFQAEASQLPVCDWGVDYSPGPATLSADFDREEAVLVRGKETALVRLASRDVVPLQLRLNPSQVAALMEALGRPADMQQTPDEWVMKCGGAASLLNGLDELGKHLDAVAQLDGWVPPEQIEAMEKAAARRSGLLGETLMPAVAAAYQRHFAALVRERMLLAAVRWQRGDPAAAEATDPTDGRPFERHAVPGGYELVSRAVVKGKPVTLRIGSASQP